MLKLPICNLINYVFCFQPQYTGTFKHTLCRCLLKPKSFYSIIPAFYIYYNRLIGPFAPYLYSLPVLLCRRPLGCHSLKFQEKCGKCRAGRELVRVFLFRKHQVFSCKKEKVLSLGNNLFLGVQM